MIPLWGRRPRRCSTTPSACWPISSSTSGSWPRRCSASFPPTAAAMTSKSTPMNPRQSVTAVIHSLRQQMAKTSGGPNLALADFVAPKESGLCDYVGMFAVTAGTGVEALVVGFESRHDDYNSIMVKALADRLAEALAERLHERVRTEFWGYAPDESLDNEELIARNVPGHPPRAGLSGVSRSHREAHPVRPPRGGASNRRAPDRELRHAARRVGERVVLLRIRRRSTSESARSAGTR